MTMRDPLIPVQPDDVQLALLSLPDRLNAILEKLEQRAALEAAVAADTWPLEEPTGLGAVVRDIYGQLWVRIPRDGVGPCWARRNEHGPRVKSWPTVQAGKVISHGTLIVGYGVGQ